MVEVIFYCFYCRGGIEVETFKITEVRSIQVNYFILLFRFLGSAEASRSYDFMILCFYLRNKIKVVTVVTAPTMMDANPNQLNRSSRRSLRLLAGAAGTQILAPDLTVG
jgi:hypothetical protein